MAGPSRDCLFDGQYRAVTPEIERYVQIIRDAFLETRKAYDPMAPMRASKAAYDHFLQTAFLVKKLGLEPREFTTRQVQAMGLTGNIFPVGLHSLKVMERQPDREEIDRDSLWTYRTQFDIFVGLHKIFTPVEAIMDPANQFTPLFRMCIAMRLGLTEFAERHRDRAKAELVLHPLARRIFPAETATL